MREYPDFLFDQTNWEWYTGDGFLAYWLESILDLSDPDNQHTSRAIARNFQSCNKLAEIVDRHIAALSPSVLNFDNPLLQDLIEKWDRENAGVFGHPLEEAALKAKIDNRAYLRLFFQKSYEEEAPLDTLEVHCPPRASVTAYRNADRFLTGFDYNYIEDGESYTEKQYLERGLTVFEKIHGSEIIERFTRDLGGGFSIVEINLKPTITDSLKRNQNEINFALTLLAHNLTYSGWIQETILNGQPPGKWEFDPQGREVFKPNDEGLASGAGISRFIQGLPLNDDRNNLTGYTNPDIRLQQPINPQTFIDTFRCLSLSMYEQADQSFVLSSDLVLSGVSREQSRRDFLDAVSSDAVKLGYVYSDLLTVANYFLGVKQRVKVELKPRIDKGLEQKELLLKAQAQGLVSKRTAIAFLGFASDPDLELAELAKEAPPEPVKASGGALPKSETKPA